MKKKKKSLVGYLGRDWYSTFRCDKYGIVSDPRKQLELQVTPALPGEKKVRITIEEI